MSKRDTFICPHCDEEIAHKDALISHLRREHVEDGGYSCWDMFGTVGDAFADGAINRMVDRAKENGKALQEAQYKAKLYDGLVPRFNRLARAIQAIGLVIENARDSNDDNK